MRKSVRMIMAMVAVLAFGATMASTASAALLPLFLTKSKQILLFTGEGPNPVLRGLQAGTPTTISCQKILIHGFILHQSTLAHLLGFLFENKCLFAGQECNPLHIVTKPILAELGLLNSTSKTVVILMTPNDGTGVFFKFNCADKETTLSGAVVGEIPEISTSFVNQYNKELTELEIRFETNPAGTEQQKITMIFLLGVEMTSQELKFEGFLSGKGALESIAILNAHGGVTLDT